MEPFMLDHLPRNDSTFTSRRALGLALAAILFAAQGCSSDTTAAPTDGGGGSGGSGGTDSGACPSGGGPLPGPAPDHCMGMFRTIGMCMKQPADGGGMATDGGDTFPEPSVGTSDNDDDCKYSVSFTNDCVQEGNPGTTFTVTLKSATGTMALVPMAKAYVEAFLTENHPAGGSNDSTEPSPGVYNIGPVVFDKPGKWTVRFHFFAGCSDTFEDSPHAYAAFFINVP
jgi:hypothetical protein